MPTGLGLKFMGSDKDSFFFESPFGYRQVVTYAINLIRSPYLTFKTRAVFNWMLLYLEKEFFLILFREEVIQRRGLDQWKVFKREGRSLRRYEDLKKAIGQPAILDLFQTKVLQVLKERKRFLSRQRTPVDDRLKSLGTTFRLSPVERGILAFLYCRNDMPGDPFREIADFDDERLWPDRLGHVLGIPAATLRAALTGGRLIQCGLVDTEHGFDLASWVTDFLSGLKTTLNENLFTRYRGPAVDLEAHLLGARELDVLKKFVNQKGPLNFLFYGEPGTGKTELVKSLARSSGKPLYLLNNKENQEASDLKSALLASTNILDPKDSLILVDDADSLLNATFSFLFSGEKNQKSWLHPFLDGNRHKIFWTVNEMRWIEPSTLRRFGFSLKFKPFSLDKKIRVFHHCLAQRGLQGFFSEADVHRLCARTTINAGGIADAIRNLKIRKNSDPALALARLETVLTHHETAVRGGRERKTHRSTGTDSYRPDILNTSEDVETVIAALAAFLDASDRHPKRHRKHLNVLLYGPSGSGKTAWVNYLGRRLPRDILYRRASDLLSCWVGETEKNLARVFEEAEENRALLFFDEADSFLRPREAAVRSWEVTEVNELLTQMETFRGVFLCATNFLNGLDSAALRRFTFKVEFRPLTPAGALELYKSLLLPLAREGRLDTAAERKIRALSSLTPGDFQVVAEKFEGREPRPSLETLIEALAQETRFKAKADRIGFLPPAGG